MKRFYIRLFISLFVIFGVSFLCFMLIHLVPGDPVQIMLGDRASSADLEQLRKALSLDRPLREQLAHYYFSLLKMDWGRSLYSKEPVLEIIMRHLPPTLLLGGTSLLFSILIAIPLGLFSAMYKNTVLDRGIQAFAFTSMSIPSFWLGPMLIWLFSIHFNWLPVNEMGDSRHLILPVLTLSTGLIAILTRMTRSSLLEVFHKDYMRSAKAKGLSPFQLYFEHALINALLPILTLVGLIAGALLTGTVIVETLFDWPGIGSLLFEAIEKRDYPLVQACVFFISLIYILVNLITDLSYEFFNPQLREIK